MLFDMPLEKLRTYQPTRQEPPDFDDFWRDTLQEAWAFDLGAVFEPIDYGLKTIDTFDVTFHGYGGQPIKGWLLLPRQRQAPQPCIVEFIDYGGRRGFPSSTVFAAYNHHVGPKEIRIWRYNNHEGGATYQDVKEVKYLTTLWG